MTGIGLGAVCLALALGLAATPPASVATANRGGAGPGSDGGCLSCHEGVEPAGAGHDMRCVACHLPPAVREAPSPGHELVIANPGAPGHARIICGPCHGERVRAVQASTHATLANLINQTRYLWGAQRTAGPVFGANGHPRPLPEPSPRPRTPAMLVDAFLRARCLGCHIGTRGPGGPGSYRGDGCAACHVEYAPDGLYAGGDRAVDRSRPGRPARHGLIVPKDDAPCLRCHHGNHVGGDLHGLFDRDSALMFQQALSWGQAMPRPHGVAEHILARDVHAERGMTCLDCHGGDQVMGLAPGERPSCEGCHGGLEALESGTPSHRPQWHGRLACGACHAQWTYGDYGLSVMRRDDGPGGEAWCTGLRFRRWETLSLGVDDRGRIAPLRSMHQYLVSYVDRLGRTVLDSVVPPRGDGSGPGWAFAPYAPHTIGASGRPCQECHGSPEAAGLPPAWAESTDMELLRASPPVPGRGRLLNAAERRRLLAPGETYKRAFAEHLLDLLEER